MSDDTKTVRRGETVTVRIGDDPDAVDGSDATGAAKTPSGAFTDNPEEELYVFRKKGDITVHDLGARRADRADDFHLVEGITSFPGLTPDAEAMRVAWNAAMLGPNMTDSMPLPLTGEDLWLDLYFYNPDMDPPQYRVLVGRPNIRAFGKDLEQEGLPAAPIATETDWKAGATVTGDTAWTFEAGMLPFKKPGGWQLAVETGWGYNTFDTFDTDHFKVTEEPDETAAQSPDFAITKGKPIKVMLTPRMFYTINGSFFLVKRIPILPAWPAPGFTSSAAKDSEVAFPNWTFLGRATTEYFNRLLDSFRVTDPSIPLDLGEFFAFDARIVFKNSSGPILVAAVQVASKMFYVWRISADPDTELTSEPSFFKYAHIVRPL